MKMNPIDILPKGKEDEMGSIEEDPELETEPRIVTSAQTRKKCQQNEIVNRLIDDAKEKGLIALDLSQKGLIKVPEELLELSQLEYLYLEGNELVCLQENFFDSFPKVQWLDLRNNKLQSIPTTYIGRHAHLRNLLLEGNQIRTLPLELGLVTTLNGLNLRNNPLEFPPQDVIDKGTQIVLLFLREVLKAKSLGIFPADATLSDLVQYYESFLENKVPQLEDLKLQDSDEYSSGEEEWGPGRHSNKKHSSGHSHPSPKTSKQSALMKEFIRSNSEDLVGPVPHSASLQRRTSYNEKRQQQLDRLKKAGALGLLESEIALKSAGRKKLAKLSQYPELPPGDKIDEKYMEEKRLARLRDLREKEEMILQRRRDQEALKDFQQESKSKQMMKQREKMMKGRLDYEEPAKQAPFGIDQNQLKMETNEERIARDVREKHEKMRRPGSPGEQQRLEEARNERDKELEKKLKEHTHHMQERRRRPRGNPQQEMEAAKKELEIAEKLQSEIEQRRKALEYRFTAFTGT